MSRPSRSVSMNRFTLQAVTQMAALCSVMCYLQDENATVVTEKEGKEFNP